MTGRRWIAVGVAALGLALALALLSAAPAGAASADESATGTITIVLDAAPNDAQDFAFTGCQGPGCGPFTLDDDADGTLANAVTATDLGPGTYTITQAAVPNWALSSLTCDTGETIDLANRRATIALTAGEHTTCTFTNTSASITIRQSSNPADAHDFTYTGCLGSGCSTFALDDDGYEALPSQTGAAGLAPGTYVITQAADANWALTSISCTTGESVSLANRRVTITLTAGEQTTCTFTNRAPSITIVQDSSPNDAQDFAFSGCQGSGCADFTLDDDADGEHPNTQSAPVLAAGTYTITQAEPPPSWPLTSLSCTTNESTDVYARQVTIVLAPGEQTTCTFKNTLDTRPATLALVEDTAPDNPQDFVLHRCLADSCTDTTLDDDNDPGHSRTTAAASLAPGVYTLSVDAVDGYETASIACTGALVTPIDARTAAVRIRPATTVTCTFTHRPPQPRLTDVTQVSVGLDHTCAVVSGGQARCWGFDQDGALGDGGFDDSSVPVVVQAPDASGPLTDVRSISAGFGHTCAALTSGEARCWGYNTNGIGDGTTVNRPRPVAVSNPAGTGPLTGVADVSAAAGYSCAELSNGEARCWGANTSAQLGDGTTTARSRPVVVGNETGTGPLTDITQIAGGQTHTCALLSSGQVRCWGANADGRLGDGTTTDRARPVAVSNPEGTGPLTGVTHLAVGYLQTCAALDTGQAVCWGKNANGQLGDGTTVTRLRPVVVSDPGGAGPLGGVTRLAAGATQTCARVDSGQAYCWGVNLSTDVGDGLAVEHHRPFAVPNPDGTGPITGVDDVTGGLRHTCLLVDGGQVRCWGRNLNGNLGDGTTVTRLRPVPTIDPSAALQPLAGVTQLSTGSVHSCARLSTGEARCWGTTALGNPDYAEALAAVPVTDIDGSGPLVGVTQVSAGETHTCAVRTDTGAVCWGANREGQLGDGTKTSRTVPTPVLDEDGSGPLTGVVQIDAGSEQTCAVLTNHEARCWGAGLLGNGLGLGGDHTLPAVVTDVAPGDGPLTDVAQVSSGDDRACAALTTGQARCWGYTPGNGTTTPPSMEPVVVSNPENTGPLTDVVAVEAGVAVSCALLGSGQGRCWGSGTGDGTTTTRVRPVAVQDTTTAPLDHIVSIHLEDGHSCLTLSTGQARCWGDNQFGEIGSPPPATGSLRPIVVNDPTDGGEMVDVADITPGRMTTCALRTSGHVRCWGVAAWHSLGNGTTRTRYVPTPVLAPLS